MSTPERGASKSERTVMYVVVMVIAIALIVIGLITYRGNKQDQAASDKADQLISAIEEAGYPAPTKDMVVGVLGHDGGATCDDPADALSKATLNSLLVNGAAGPGMRPVLADSLAVKGQLLIIKVYCPDELEHFQNVVDDLKFHATVKQQ